MKKIFFFLLAFLFVINLSFISSASIEDEFRKLANYAGEYETGNINYVQLLVYMSAIREEMNSAFGATNKELGGVLKEDQLKAVLGEPTETTKWVWAEKQEKEIKLDKEVPVWRKVIFDGKKIQIRLNAWPSVFGKKKFEEENKNEELKDLEGKLIYRLHSEIEFKKPEEQTNIQGKIEKIQTLAQTFSSNPSRENAEVLAKESVNAERIFESYFRQNNGKCEDIMNSIFGAENKRQTQKLLVQEISFCEGDNFEVIARLEMCDECEWNWINLDFWVQGRGPGFKLKEEEMKPLSPEIYKDMSAVDFESEVQRKINGLKQACNISDFKTIMRAKNEFWPLNEAWNKKSNDVWKEIDQIFNSQIESMTQEQRQKFDQNYGWIKQEQEKRKRVKELSKANYEQRKQFYLGLFSGYDKKEYYFTQVEFQKRIVEEFMERGEEICDNNQDDNENKAIDCADEQCGGKICGKGKKSVQEGNETKEIEDDFYCIEKECRAKEELPKMIMNVSGICQELPPVECPEGSKVFFSRYDNETNCPIETGCLEETEFCEANEDCRQPACGVAECIENKCKVTSLTECRALECIAGDEKICNSDGRIIEICNNGFWEKTGECEEEPELRDEAIVGEECLSASDCGSNNVCNNGLCQVLPQLAVPVESVEETVYEETEEETQEQTIEEESPEQQGTEEVETSSIESEPTGSESEQEEPSPDTSQQSESEITENVLFNSLVSLFSKITGFEVEETASETTPAQEEQEQEEAQSSEPSEEQEQQESQEQTQEPQSEEDREQEDREREEDRRERKEKEGEERREREEEQRREEDRKRCEKDCERPCVEKCIRTECGEELNCVVDAAQKKCEETCKAEDNCVEKCMKGGDWWKEFQEKDDFKKEKGVFQVGGNCRTSQGKTEGFIWFGGWGESFEKIQTLKNKYYSGGQTDWCKYDFENLKKQRQEFEKGFNQEFVAWFFEKYLANSVENWEQSVSGIFELYWKDVDNSREMAYRMQCLEKDELPSIDLINVTYDTEYGSIEFWEEIRTVKLEGMEKEMQVISPYMKIWIFPTKEFLVYELKQSMENNEFPGSPEEKMERDNEEGPTEEEIAMIKQNEKFMKSIKKISEKYGGNLDISLQLKDYDTEETVFNLYVQINENEILRMKPMLPEDVPAEDVHIEIDFEMIYDMVYEMEKEMSGERIETPPWDRRESPVQKIKEIGNGIKMYFKIMRIMNSAKITPAGAEDDVKDLFKKFMSMMMKSQGGGEPEGEKEDKTDDKTKELKEDVFGSKEAITGEVIL